MPLSSVQDSSWEKLLEEEEIEFPRVNRLLRVFDVLGYLEFFLCFSSVSGRWFAFFVFVVIIGRSDPAKLGTRLADTSLACTDVGKLPSTAPRSYVFARHPESSWQFAFFNNLVYCFKDDSIDLGAMILLLRGLHCRPFLELDAHFAPRCSGSTCSTSLCFLFSSIYLCLHNTKFCSTFTSSFSCYTPLWILLCALVEQELR